MTPAFHKPRAVVLTQWAVALVCASLCGCSLLHPAAATPPSFYALEDAPPTATQVPAGNSRSNTATATLTISPVRAAAGFDSQRIIYVRESHKLEYFSHSEWVEPPVRMLGPLLVASIERTGAFRAVVQTPASASGELRLDTEIVRLQQEFLTSPSVVHFTLRAYLVDEKTRRVVIWREFDGSVPTTSDDPKAGVVAANQVVQNVLKDLAQFVAQRPQ